MCPTLYTATLLFKNFIFLQKKVEIFHIKQLQLSAQTSALKFETIRLNQMEFDNSEWLSARCCRTARKQLRGIRNTIRSATSCPIASIGKQIGGVLFQDQRCYKQTVNPPNF